jgi:hypothetical protein
VADRLDLEIDLELETGLITGHAGPGIDRGVSPDRTAAVIDREIKLKSRKRGPYSMPIHTDLAGI